MQSEQTTSSFSDSDQDIDIQQEKQQQQATWSGNVHLNPKKRAHVVIIGAGLAGLAAAQRLYEAGVKDVIILEAQDRIGGRVHTIRHSNNILELVSAPG